MASTVSKSDPRTPANDLRSDLQQVRTRTLKAGIGVKATRLSSLEFLSLVQQARADCNLSQKAFAINAAGSGCSESALSEALIGQRHFSAAWLWDQPDAFLLALIARIEAARRLSPERTLELKAARIGELVKLLVEVA